MSNEDIQGLLRYHEDFSTSQEKQEFFLMEFSEQPSETAMTDIAPTVGLIKRFSTNGKTNEAFFCTEDKISALVSNENSNSTCIASKVGEEFHIICDLTDVVTQQDSSPVFTVALELLRKAPLGSGLLVTWNDLICCVPASEQALRKLVLNHPCCIPCGPLQWQWLSPKDRYSLSDTMMQVIVAEGFKDVVPVTFMLERARLVLGTLSAEMVEAVVQKCLQADLCDENYRVDFDKIAEFCARSFLYDTRKMSRDLFLRRWQSKLPQERGIDSLKPPVYIFDNEVHFIEEFELSSDPVRRLKYLFTLQKKWRPQMLIQAISGALPCAIPDKWLLKNARLLVIGDEKFYIEKFTLSS